MWVVHVENEKYSVSPTKTVKFKLDDSLVEKESLKCLSSEPPIPFDSFTDVSICYYKLLYIL